MTAAPRRRPGLGSLIFTALLWLTAVGILVGALGFRYPANLAPLLLGGTATALLTWLLVAETLKYWRADGREGTADDATPATTVVPTDSGGVPDNPTPVDDPLAAQAAAERAIAAATSPGVVGTILPDTDPSALKHERAALAWTVASVVVMLLIGFLAGATVAMLALLRVYARESWRMSLITTALVMVTLYVAFGLILRVPFFPGLILELLGLA